ncbi:hypothetical protein E2C01_032517 [Portunus trituberculatus]|uniref:Uncharacterized protein n=1 Tax=Portunus trituberculatus TaxID=210409 RepID=A0A5B7F153_PORTR|nr:hypothetical protein [Portunus trituberculatus]
MDASPDPTVVFTALKDFQTFLGNSRSFSASRGGTEARRLNFSSFSRDTSSASLPSPNSPGYPRGQKRNLDSIVGFEIYGLKEILFCGTSYLEAHPLGNRCPE